MKQHYKLFIFSLLSLYSINLLTSPTVSLSPASVFPNYYSSNNPRERLVERTVPASDELRTEGITDEHNHTDNTIEMRRNSARKYLKYCGGVTLAAVLFASGLARLYMAIVPKPE